MKQQKATVACLLLFILALAVQASDLGKFQRPNRRALLQRNATSDAPPDEPQSEEIEAEGEMDDEAKREAAALAAFEEARERRANESALLIEEAFATSAETVQVYLSSTKEERIELLTDLLRNADGLAFKFTLNTLASTDDRTGRLAVRYAYRAIGNAIREGFGSNVAQAVSYAFTIQNNENDHFNFLEAIDLRRRRLDSWRKGVGCQFVKDLFTDADTFAEQRSESMTFIAAFDDEEYLPMMECFLDACTGKAAQCCGSSRATRTGRCGCQRSGRCDYNIFANRPRTIWVCSSSTCAANEKCLCSPVQ